MLHPSIVRALPLAVALVACGSPTSDADAGPSVEDAGADGGGDRDAGHDAGPLTCAEALSDRRVALDRSGVLTQIHAVAAWDGEGIWVAYSRRGELDGAGFDVFATRLGCGGERLVEPFLVSSDPTFGSDIDPDLAVDGDRLLIAWSADDGTGGSDNLHVRYRLFDVDGTPRGEDRSLRTRYAGAEVEGNHFGVKIAARPDGGFVAAGARGLPGIDRFSAYAQPLTRDGELDGEALDPLVEMEVTQTAVDVDVAEDGTIWVAYDRAPDEGPTAVHVAALGGDPPGPALEDPAVTGSASVLVAGDATWVAFGGTTTFGIDLRLVDVNVPLAERAPASIGESDRTEGTPWLARGDDGTMAIAWFRQIRGSTSELIAARFAPSPDGSPTVGEAVRGDLNGVPSYEPALTHVMGDWWFVAFSEGDNPDFRIVGRFLELPAP